MAATALGNLDMRFISEKRETTLIASKERLVNFQAIFK